MILGVEIPSVQFHPSVIREYKHLCRLLAMVLVALGRPADQAEREAESLLLHMPPASHRPGRRPAHSAEVVPSLK